MTALAGPDARLPLAAALALAVLFACDHPSNSLRANTSTAPPSEASQVGSAPVASSSPTDCPAEHGRPPFADGAWSVHSLACAQGALTASERFVLRAIPTGGNSCFCPENVACAPCMPYRMFRDARGDELFVTLRGELPPGLSDGVRVDVPVRLFKWGSSPPAALAELVWAR